MTTIAALVQILNIKCRLVPAITIKKKYFKSHVMPNCLVLVVLLLAPTSWNGFKCLAFILPSMKLGAFFADFTVFTKHESLIQSHNAFES